MPGSARKAPGPLKPQISDLVFQFPALRSLVRAYEALLPAAVSGREQGFPPFFAIVIVLILRPRFHFLKTKTEDDDEHEDERKPDSAKCQRTAEVQCQCIAPPSPATNGRQPPLLHIFRHLQNGENNDGLFDHLLTGLRDGLQPGCFGVAQSCTLLYRRIAPGRTWNGSAASEFQGA